MDKEIIKAAMQFMMRANLKGEEVPAFNAVMNAMQAEIEKPSTLTGFDENSAKSVPCSDNQETQL